MAKRKAASYMTPGEQIAGVIFFLIYLLVLPFATAPLLVLFFVISGVIRIVSAIVELGLPAGWRVLDIIVGLLLTVGGIVMLFQQACRSAPSTAFGRHSV